MLSNQSKNSSADSNIHINSIELNIKKLELETITLLQKDAVNDFSNTEDFAEAMSNIRMLCDCEFICFASSFHDQANEEYSISVFLFYEGSLQKFHFTIDSSKRKFNNILNSPDKFDKRNTYEFISDLTGLIKLSKEQYQPTDLDLLSITIEKTAAQADCHYNFFKDKGHISGWIIHDSKDQDHIYERYPTLYSTLEFLLSNEMNKIVAKNELNTYQQVLDLMPQRVFWKNKTSVYTGSNLAFAKDASKQSASQLVGLTDHDIFPDQAQLYRKDDANTMESRIHLINSQEPQTHENGKTIWLRTSKRPIIGNDDKVIGVVGTYDEITELKDVQAQLQASKDQLEQRVNDRTKELSDSVEELKQAQSKLIESEKMAALGGLVAGIAHEINTPIGVSVTGASHLHEVASELKNDYENQSLKKSALNNYCDKILEASNIILSNLNRAANQIENFKLIAVDQSKDLKRPLDLNSYIPSIISTLSPKLRNKDIQIKLEITDECTISTYPGALSQVMTNLIENSIFHGFANKESGNIDINIAKKDNRLEILYQDNGEGISSEHLNKIYEPFYTSKRGQGGSGLGMHIVYNLVTRQLGGNINCTSEINEGVKFVISMDT